MLEAGAAGGEGGRKKRGDASIWPKVSWLLQRAAWRVTICARGDSGPAHNACSSQLLPLCSLEPLAQPPLCTISVLKNKHSRPLRLPLQYYILHRQQALTPAPPSEEGVCPALHRSSHRSSELPAPVAQSRLFGTLEYRAGSWVL